MNKQEELEERIKKLEKQLHKCNTCLNYRYDGDKCDPYSVPNPYDLNKVAKMRRKYKKDNG